jgi:hypothetical protein
MAIVRAADRSLSETKIDLSALTTAWLLLDTSIQRRSFLARMVGDNQVFSL